jgi:hypothetical protein
MVLHDASHCHHGHRRKEGGARGRQPAEARFVAREKPARPGTFETAPRRREAFESFQRVAASIFAAARQH